MNWTKYLEFQALAQTTRIDDKIDVRATDVTIGDRVPFSGKLLTIDALAKLISYYKTAIAKLEADLIYQQKVCDAKLSAKIDTCTIESSACKKLVNNCQQVCDAEKKVYTVAIERASKTCERKWYESPWIPLVGGVIICGSSVAVGSLVK
ncbi:hypothetical protein MUP59_02745 [Candidatus Bathyarchaeota archaeon]|nr:hypothetical protein [Candidatus Bathyarchaeota archaeon]